MRFPRHFSTCARRGAAARPQAEAAEKRSIQAAPPRPLGVNDAQRTMAVMAGIEGSALPIGGLTKPVVELQAKRFLRWRKKNNKAPKPKKPKVIRRWCR